jgi:hypothetical protein
VRGRLNELQSTSSSQADALGFIPATVRRRFLGRLLEISANGVAMCAGIRIACVPSNVLRLIGRSLHGSALAVAFACQACGPHAGAALDAPTSPAETKLDASTEAATVPSSSGDAGGDVASEAAAPFQADAPTVYVAKVKNVLVGLPPTDAEIQAVQADPTQLKSLIDGWMALPQYTEKMTTFFELAFQQTQVAAIDFADQVFPRQVDVNGTTTPLLVQNTRESFARTVLAMASAGQPFNSAMTTQSFMLTPALMELYAFLDAWQVDDASKVTDRFKAANPKLMLTVEAAQGPIPIAQTLDPQSPNYMVWYDPDVADIGVDGARLRSRPGRLSGGRRCPSLHSHGIASGPEEPDRWQLRAAQRNGHRAPATAADYTTWKMVTIRPPATGESPTAFYDLPTLRAATELVLVTPRVGFFSTPAFFANWQTNTSNQMRVTMNQSLIVATGAQVDGTDTTMPTSTPGLDAGSRRAARLRFCHRTLDPTRSILAATYSWNYHQQDETAFSEQDGLFEFQGVIKPVSSVGDLGATLASHPLMPSAWVQKLCYYVNSSPCEPTDPEFQRIVGVFQSSSLSWNALVRELFSSPLTTYARPRRRTDNGEVIAVSRRDHLCAALNARLGFADVCGLDATTKVEARTSIPEIVSGLPSDGYGRGA